MDKEKEKKKTEESVKPHDSNSRASWVHHQNLAGKNNCKLPAWSGNHCNDGGFLTECLNLANFSFEGYHSRGTSVTQYLFMHEVNQGKCAKTFGCAFSR